MKKAIRFTSIVLMLALVLTLLPMGVLAADSKATAPTITLQPKTKVFYEDATATFTVKASGTGLKYQWFYRNSSSDSWHKYVGMTTGTLKLTAKASRSGHQYFCKITNSAGKYVYSKTATLYVNLVRYRALVIGQSYSGNSSISNLPACANDAYRIKNMLGAVQGSKGRNWIITTKINASYYGIKNGISSVFANADANDVSLFYYSGHGATDGSLVTSEGSNDYNFISAYQLASMLKEVPGKVIVMMDSCHSGAVIGKDFDKASGEGNFSDSVVKAFSAQDVAIKDFSTGDIAKSGPLTTSKFLVLTACMQSQMSFCNSDYSYFTYYTALGGRGYADSNKNKLVSLKELYGYVYRNTKDPLHDSSGNTYYQFTQVYPTGSYYTVFKNK